MKRRWAVIFWSSIACLVGFTLVAAKLGLRTWDLIGVHMVGMVVAGVAAFAAMVLQTRSKWPAGIVILGTTPMSSVALVAFLGETWFLDVLGLAGVLTFAASLCTSIAAIVVAFMPPPSAEPRELARARVVDDSQPR